MPAYVPPLQLGPGPDDKPERGLTVWKFLTIVGGTEIYVKLGVLGSNPDELICMSFHWAKNPMETPYRQRGS